MINGYFFVYNHFILLIRFLKKRDPSSPDRDLAEEALDELSAEGSVFEQRFGWFKQTS